MKQLTALVRSAIGYDEKRGDSVEVVNMRFAPVGRAAHRVAPPHDFMGFEKADLMRMGETLVLALVAVLVILLVIRPLINRVLDGAAPAAAAARALAPAARRGRGGTAALPRARRRRRRRARAARRQANEPAR